MKTKDNRYYHTLMCGHIRLIDLSRIQIVRGETEVYCRACDDFRVVKGKSPRWDAKIEREN